MLYLKNEELTVSLLHPIDDQERLGFRYVAGGYAYQVQDAVHGPLFSGPVYPRPWPPVFDGQGVPEAFRSLKVAEGKTLVPGVGMVAHREVQEWCAWEIEQGKGRLIMRTYQQAGGWSFSLVKEVVLRERTLTSVTHLRNQGEPLSFSWYAHPFFPLCADGTCCALAFAARLADNPGFRFNEEGFIQMKPEFDWQKGHYQLIEGVEGKILEAVQKHPLLGQVRVSGDFPMARMPIWANASTVSFEPFREDTLAPGGEARWSISYHL